MKEDAWRSHTAGRNTHLLLAQRVRSADQVRPVVHNAALSFHVLLLLCSYSASHQLYCRCTRLPKVYLNFSVSRDTSALRNRAITWCSHKEALISCSSWPAAFKCIDCCFVIQRQIKETKKDAKRFRLMIGLSVLSSFSSDWCVFIHTFHTELQLQRLSDWFQVLAQGQNVEWAEQIQSSREAKSGGPPWDLMSENICI